MFQKRGGKRRGGERDSVKSLPPLHPDLTVTKFE